MAKEKLNKGGELIKRINHLIEQRKKWEEALTICKAMNDEAEELLFRVYNSNTNKLVK